jgi:hypothetical protein
MCGFSKTSTRFRVPGIGYRLSGTWDLVPGTGAGPTPRTEHRAPKTEPGHRKTRTPGLLSFEMRIWDAGSGFALRQGLSCILHTPCAGFSKREPGIPPGIGCQVPGTSYLVPDTRYRINAEDRTPSTEDRARLPENAHTGFASCILCLDLTPGSMPGGTAGGEPGDR